MFSAYGDGVWVLGDIPSPELDGINSPPPLPWIYMYKFFSYDYELWGNNCGNVGYIFFFLSVQDTIFKLKCDPNTFSCWGYTAANSILEKE